MVVKLPLDIISLIADQVDERIPTPQYGEDVVIEQIRKRQEAGRAMALVCKEWRSVGTELVWRSVSCTLPGDAALLGHLLLYSKLSRLVKELGIECDSGEDAQVTMGMDLGFFLSRCTNLRKIRLNAPVEVLFRLLAHDEDTRSPPDITALYVETLQYISAEQATQLLETLRGVHNLQRLFLSFYPGNASLPASPPPNVPPLRLRRLQLTPYAPSSSSQRHVWSERLILSVDPLFLHTLSLWIERPRPDSLYSYIKSATNLVTLALMMEQDSLLELLPNLGDLLSFLPSLQYLALDDISGEPGQINTRPRLELLLAGLSKGLVAVHLAVDFRGFEGLLARFLHTRLELPLAHFSWTSVIVTAASRSLEEMVTVKRTDEAGAPYWTSVDYWQEPWQDLLPEGILWAV